jgi:hypothetical protein
MDTPIGLDLLARFPQLAGFLVAPAHVTCHQGAHQTSAYVLAERGDRVLYFAQPTGQLGIAMLSAARRDHVFGATQFPTLELAIVTFLAEEIETIPLDH